MATQHGIQYLIDDKGKKRSAVINLDIYGALWEDVHDMLMVESRKQEPRVKWAEVKKRCHQGKLSNAKI
jgi:hypothetical protein